MNEWDALLKVAGDHLKLYLRDVEKELRHRELSSERRQAKRSRHEVNAMRSRFQTAALQAQQGEKHSSSMM